MVAWRGGALLLSSLASGSVSPVTAAGTVVEIPAPLAMADAANLVSDPAGALYQVSTGPDLSLHTSVSLDAGESWSEVSRTPPGPGEALSLWAADVAVLDVALLSADAAQIFHRRSRDGGRSWSDPVPVRPVVWPRDRSYLVLRSNPSGRVAIVVMSSYDQLQVSISPDEGSSWAAPVSLVSSSRAAFETAAQVWIDETTLLVCWIGFSGDDELRCRRSADGGASFGGSVLVWAARGMARPRLVAITPSEVTLVAFESSAAGPPRVIALRSPDAAMTWIGPATVLSGPFHPDVAIAADRSGLLLAAIAVDDGEGYRVRVLRSTDGLSWSEAMAPPEGDCGLADVSGVELAAPGTPWQFVLRAGPPLSALTWSTRDAGMSWAEPRSIRPFLPAIHQVLAAELPGARFAVVWRGGRDEAPDVRTSISEDGGASWSPAIAVSDRPGSPRWPMDVASRRQMETLVTSRGSWLVLWEARAEASCFEARISRSIDGRVWDPSIALGEGVYPTLSLVEDASGDLIAGWRGEPGLLVARSADDGLTWSAPELALEHPATLSRPLSRIVRARDGALLLVSGAGWPLQALRSEDGGRGWSVHNLPPWHAPSRLEGWLDLVVAGGSAQVLYGGNSTWNVYFSPDDGRSWSETCMPRPGAPLAGDPSGNVLWSGLPGEVQLWAHTAAGTCRTRAQLPAVPRWLPALLLRPGGELCSATATDGAVPGTEAIVWECEPPRVLARHDETRRLDPRPDLGQIFPLPPLDGFAGGAGAEVADSALRNPFRVLGFYQLLDARGRVLLLTKNAAHTAIRVWW